MAPEEQREAKAKTDTPPRGGPRVGPWLRSYGAPAKPPWRERVVTALIGLGVAAAFAVVLFGVLWAFVRWPLFTFAGLVLVWILGMVVFAVKRQRARLRDQLLRQARQAGRQAGS
jgi:hypothetical protein